MTIEKVIELGKEIVKPDYPWYSEFTMGIWIIIIVLILIGVLLFLWGSIDAGEGRGLLGSIMLFIAVLIFSAYLASSDTKENEVYEEKVEEWKNQIAK